MKKSFLVLLIFFQSCTILLVNPPKKKSQGLLGDPLTLLSLLILINNDACGNRNGNGRFWVRNIETNSSYCVNSRLVGSGGNADFYVESNLETGIDFTDVANQYRLNIAPALSATFGEPTDINKDKKIIILTLDIIDGGSSSRGFVAGFVDPVNFLEDAFGSKLRSNQMEILYMDGKELAIKRKKSLEAGEKDPYLSTVAHELQHLIRFPKSLGEDQTWIDEGTAEVASDLAGYGPQVDRFNCFRGVSCNSFGIQTTSPFTWSSTLENYAYSYAFMRYLYLASGTTDTGRRAFLNSTVIGKNNFRGNDATGLMEIFKLSESYTNKTGSVPTDNSLLFQYLLTYFFGRSQGYTDFTGTNVSFSNTQTDLSAIQSNFPLNYSSYSGSTILVFANKLSGSGTLKPGAVVYKNLPISPSTTGATVKDSSTYIALNPNYSGSSISASQISSIEEEPISLHEGANCITSNYFFQESRTRSHARRYLFDKP